MTDRNWRDAKPKWVVDAAQAEMADMRRTLALRWPTEAEPKPLFGFGDYDKEIGDIQFGTFWVATYRSVVRVCIREKVEGEHGWRRYRFSSNGGEFGTNVVRGPYFHTEREARLKVLWNACRDAARDLEGHWTKFENVDASHGS